MEEGAVSLGVAVLIFIYYAYIKKPEPRRESTFRYDPNNSFDVEFAEEQARVVDKVLKNINKKTPEEWWKGKSEAEFKWFLNCHHEGPDYSHEVPYPQPSGIPEYFEYLKTNKPNSYEFHTGVHIGNGGLYSPN